MPGRSKRSYLLKQSAAFRRRFVKLFHDGIPYHKEVSPLVFRANQWTGFHMIGTSVMKKFCTYDLATTRH